VAGHAAADGKIAVSIVNGTAVANGAPASCYASGTAVNNVTMVNCLNVTRARDVTWETAPTCPDAPTAANSVADAEGRLWGWISAAGKTGASCCYKDLAGNPVYEVAAAAPAPSASTTAPASASRAASAGAAVAPSAAGPPPTTTVVTGETIADAAPSLPINPFR